MLGDRTNNIPVPEFFDGIKGPHLKLFVEYLQMLNDQPRVIWEIMSVYMKKYFKGESKLWFEAHRRGWDSF